MPIDRTAIEESLRNTLGAADQMIGESARKYVGEVDADEARLADRKPAVWRAATERRTRVVDVDAAKPDNLIRTVDDERIMACRDDSLLLANVLYLTGTSDTHPVQLATRLGKWGIAVVLDAEWRRLEADRGLRRDIPQAHRADALSRERAAARYDEHPHHPDARDGYIGGCPACWLAYGKTQGWVK